MEVRLAVLADAANVTADNKLNILGVFDTIAAPSVPVQIPHICVVIKLRGSPGEKGTRHTMRIVIVDEDGRFIFQGGDLPFAFVSHLPGPDVDMHIISNLMGINIEQFGTYRVDVTIDDTSAAQFTLRLAQLHLPPGMMPTPPPPPTGNLGG